MLLNTIIIIVVFLCGLSNLVLSIYVYAKNTKATVNRHFFYFGFTVSVWCFTNFISLMVKDLFWLRAAYATGSVVPLLGIFFTYPLSGQKPHRFFLPLLSVACAIFFGIALFTSQVIQNLATFSTFGFQVTFGPLFNWWGFYLIILSAAALLVPISVVHKVDEQRKKQILYYITGATVFAFWAIFVTVILPLLGFTQFGDVDTPATIFLVGFTSYAIIKFHLMDISSLLFQAFIYALVIVIIIALLMLLMLVGSFLFAHSLIWPLYMIAVVISFVLFYIGRLFFVEKRDLEKAKINLTRLLERSEENRIKAEKERDKTATIVNSFTDGLIIIDQQNNIFSINPEAEKILSLQKNALVGKPFQAMTYFKKADPIVSILASSLKNIFRKEVALGKDLTVELSVISLGTAKNNNGYLVVLHDVSREKVVDKMKTEFVSLAAHQLRTPLSIIKWTMSMLKHGDFGKLTKKQNELVKSSFENNERLISLVNDLLDVTRIEEGRYLYNIALADIRDILHSVLDMYKSQIKKRKITIEFKEPKDFPSTMIDSEKLKLVVQNFIDNAIQYSAAGGRIIITLSCDQETITLRVQDFGMGIPRNQQDKIFTKFFRGDNAVKIHTDGSGLGLFLAKNIVEAHGGTIWFESEENKGTDFYFSLPIKKS